MTVKKQQGSIGAGLEGEPMTSAEPHQKEKKKLIFTAGEGAFTAESRD